MAINLDKESIEKTDLDPSGSYSTENDEIEVTSESLKESTQIHGWLSFFLFQMGIGGFISAVYPLATFKLDDYDGSYILGMTDVIGGILLFILSIFAIRAFRRRKPNAVFLGTSYTILCVILNLLVLCYGDFEQDGLATAPKTFRSLVWGCIWLCYLHQSNQVEEIIPTDFRKSSKRDYLLVASVIVVPLLFMVVGIFDAIRIQNAENEKAVQRYNENHRNFYSDIKNSLTPNQYSDGRIIFDAPDGFECVDTVIQNSKVFELEKEHCAHVTLCSDFDTDNSDENIDRYWKNWEDKSIAKCKSSLVKDTKDYTDKYSKSIKVQKYIVNGNAMYWRFVMLFDTETGKVCLISAYDVYDEGEDDYLNALIESIQFHP